MPSLFRGYEILRIRNYRLYWIGHWISLIGTWMQSATQAWLLTRLTDDRFTLGLLGAASSAPFLFFVLAGGWLSDRHDKRQLIIVTQILSLLQALAMAYVTLLGTVSPIQIIVLAAVLGVINAFDIPARQSFLIQLVGVEHLPSAIALNATAFNVARVVGPAMAGFLVAMTGEGICFLINAISYIAVVWGLYLIRPQPLPAPTDRRHDTSIWAGLQHIAARPDVRHVLLLVGVVSAVGVSYRTFLPAMARDVLLIDAGRYGLLMAAAGAGAGLAGFVLAGMSVSRPTYWRILPLALVTFALALGGFAWSTSYDLSLLLLFAVGGGGVVYFNVSNTLVQLNVDNQYRGRVMAVYALMHQGTATFGSLLLGGMAAAHGTPLALFVGALLCVISLLAFVVVRAKVTAAGEVR